MSVAGITSSLLPYTSLDTKKASILGEMSSGLLASVGTDSAMSGLTDLIADGMTDLCTISAVGSSLNAIAKEAREAGVSDVMENVQLFARTLQEEGTDNMSILQYLVRAKQILESDPETFAAIFADAAEESDAAETADAIDDADGADVDADATADTANAESAAD